MVLSPEQLFTRFRDWLIVSTDLAWNSSRRDWTTAIKQFFDTLGSTERFEVIFTRQGVSEYLLDLVWMQRSPRRFIQLGLESEMSETRARCTRAFDKLTDTKAYTKVGIFRTNPTLEDELFRIFRQHLNDHLIPIPTERYLVIFLSYESSRNRMKITCYLLEYTGSYEKLCEDYFPFRES